MQSGFSSGICAPVDWMPTFSCEIDVLLTVMFWDKEELIVQILFHRVKNNKRQVDNYEGRILPS